MCMPPPPLSLSVIIPTYNRKHLIGRTIDSILLQNRTDFELIIVDDGSTDGTMEFLQNYQDERIRIFQKTNGGVSSARNLGLENARGEYVTFIDSDDWISQGFFEDALGAFEQKQVDAVFYGGDLVTKWRCKVVPPFCGQKLENPVFYYDSLFENFCLSGGNSWGCAKFFRRSVIENHQLCFDQAIDYGEDLTFILEFLLFARSLEVRLGVFYHCDVRHQSLGRGHLTSQEKMMSLLRGYQKITLRLKADHQEELLYALNTIMAIHASNLYLSCFDLAWAKGEWKSQLLALCDNPNQRVNKIQSLQKILIRYSFVGFFVWYFVLVSLRLIPQSFKRQIKRYVFNIKDASEKCK